MWIKSQFRGKVRTLLRKFLYFIGNMFSIRSNWMIMKRIRLVIQKIQEEMVMILSLKFSAHDNRSAPLQFECHICRLYEDTQCFGCQQERYLVRSVKFLVCFSNFSEIANSCDFLNIVNLKVERTISSSVMSFEDAKKLSSTSSSIKNLNLYDIATFYSASTHSKFYCSHICKALNTMNYLCCVDYLGTAFRSSNSFMNIGVSIVNTLDIKNFVKRMDTLVLLYY